jgi:uncharacterized protein YyaL (SSP411 family)
MRIHEKGEIFTNRLIQATSPYLRQHAKNPVDWYPWGFEAIDRAKAENKPIFLSVGYSTCYWCHVMEREVFENPSIASVMNKYFINIKVDREEHPQVDEIYMAARQLMTQEGGWPNNVFLTPNLMPFYAGGTYAATAKYNKPAFTDLLHSVQVEWEEEPEKIKDIALKIATAMQEHLMVEAGEPYTDFSPMIGHARAQLAKHHDVESGGFFQAPKFPQENYLQFLLAHFIATRDQSSLDMALFSLRKMAAGGINDHVGAGFHRYAVDRDWMVPHFEKMLYTQGMLARIYTEAAQLSGNSYLTDIAMSICDFVAGPFTDGRGAFYSAIDAETDGVEGAYYAWTTDELEQILSPDEIDFFIHHYALADIPHFPGHKHPDGEVILARQPLDEASAAQKLQYEQIAQVCGSVMNKLLSARNMKRIAPHLDNKIIVGWNGLMIDGLAYAGIVFKRPDYIQRAHRAADYLLRTAIDNNGQLSRTVMHGKAQNKATLEDYAYLVRGLLTLHRADSAYGLLTPALQLMESAEALLRDKESEGFFTAQDNDIIPMRIKNGDDSALPNANATMAQNYLTLFVLTGEPSYREKAEKIVHFFISGEHNWLEFTSMLTVAIQLQQRVDVTALAQVQEKEKIVAMSGEVVPTGPKNYSLKLVLNIKDGWHIQPDASQQPDGTATYISVQAPGVYVADYPFPKAAGGVYRGKVELAMPLVLSAQQQVRPEIRVMIGYHPCNETACFAAINDAIIL